MLVCPECQFENPDDQESCQECGTSLTHKTCTECGEKVSWRADHCPNCGAFTANIWRALISLHSTLHGEKTDTQELSNLPSIAEEYLDPEQRYQLFQGDLGQLSSQFLAVKVIDHTPLQKSKLDILLQKNPEILEYIAENSGKFEENKNGVPSIALSYLRLEEFYPLIPDVQDSWLIDNKYQVILLSDRSHLKSVSELITKENLSIIEILYWFDEIIKPWKLLHKVCCAQSLLEVSNLRVDEDESFCLQQLYFDSEQQPPEVKDLASTYLSLVASSSYQDHPIIKRIIEDLETEKITNVDQLHTVLQEIAIEEQSSAPVTNDLPDNLEIENEKEQVFLGINEGEDTPTVVLPMQLNSLTDAAATDIGLQRVHNEDFFGIYAEIKKQANNKGKSIIAQGLYIVCDGMGGHDAGEVASTMAVEKLQNYFQEHWQNQLPDYDTIRNGILLANQTIYDINKENQSSGSGRMGTTMVMALVQNTKVAIAHVGDSRIYRFTRKGGLEQLTLDHEVGQREILRGVEPDIAYARPDAFQLTQALGPRNNNFVEPEINFFDINEDSLFILCSDGLCDNNLMEEYALPHLPNFLSSSFNLDEAALKLINLANEYNGHDNITTILVRIKVRPNLQEQIWF